MVDRQSFLGVLSFLLGFTTILGLPVFILSQIVVWHYLPFWTKDFIFDYSVLVQSFLLMFAGIRLNPSFVKKVMKYEKYLSLITIAEVQGLGVIILTVLVILLTGHSPTPIPPLRWLWAGVAGFGFFYRKWRMVGGPWSMNVHYELLGLVISLDFLLLVPVQ